MGKDFYYSEDCSFFYQIGSVKTNKPWQRPEYSRVYSFLTDSEVLNILEKYENSYIYGSFIWKDIQTWDLDLGLKKTFEGLDWDQIELDFNILNTISLSKYSLLIDLSLREDEYQMPTKYELESFNSGREIEDWFYVKSKNSIVKISYYHKKSCNDEIIFDFRKSDKIGHLTKNLTKNHLVLIDYSKLEHPKKVISRILSSQMEDPKPKIDIKYFLNLSQPEFEQVKNY
jgi:hypothetical protein